MTVTAWRIYKPKHAPTAFTGAGARLYGGRFNSKGVAVVYTASSISLACLEMLVRLQASEILKSYLLCDVKFDQRLVEALDRKALPKQWRESPVPEDLQQLGDAWVMPNTSAILEVPSAIVANESNFLLNPEHPDFKHVEIGKARPHRFDPRLLKTS